MTLTLASDWAAQTPATGKQITFNSTRLLGAGGLKMCFQQTLLASKTAISLTWVNWGRHYGFMIPTQLPLIFKTTEKQLPNT